MSYDHGINLSIIMDEQSVPALGPSAKLFIANFRQQARLAECFENLNQYLESRVDALILEMVKAEENKFSQSDLNHVYAYLISHKSSKIEKFTKRICAILDNKLPITFRERVSKCLTTTASNIRKRFTRQGYAKNVVVPLEQPYVQRVSQDGREETKSK